METNSKQSSSTGEFKGSKSLLIFLISSILFIQRAVAQADISHLKKNLKAMEETQKKIAHDEFMSYVYMTVGFAIVIAIAWFSTVAARKRNEKEQDEKQKYILRQQGLKKHGHHHGHHAATTRARR